MAGIASRIHQGRYDTETELLSLLKNSKAKNNEDVQDAVEQRLKKTFPKLYQRYVGPLFSRNRDATFSCYCNKPKSLEGVCNDILNDRVPIDALTCDACWKEDLSTTWGYYGYTRKIISTSMWKALCDERADFKFVE